MALLIVDIPLLSVIRSANVQVETALEVQVPRVRFTLGAAVPPPTTICSVELKAEIVYGCSQARHHHIVGGSQVLLTRCIA